MSKDSVINDLLSRIAILEFEVERLENIMNELDRLLTNQIEDYKDVEIEELQAMVQEDKHIRFILQMLKEKD